jgi:hypothetical protein
MIINCDPPIGGADDLNNEKNTLEMINTPISGVIKKLIR